MEIHLSRSDCEGCPLALALYFKVVKDLGYLLHNRMAQGLIKGITLPESYDKHLVNGHFVKILSSQSLRVSLQ